MPRGAFASAAALAACLLLLTGCVQDSSDGRPAGGLTAEDQRALEQLRPIAARDADVDGAVGEVECWRPSESMVDERQWRVICRVHYAQDGQARHRDMICIDDSSVDPVTDYCYPWAPYSDMPSFEDQAAVSARS